MNLVLPKKSVVHCTTLVWLSQRTVADFPEKLDKIQKKNFRNFKVVPVNILNRALLRISRRDR